MTDLYKAAVNTDQASALKLQFARIFGEHAEFVQGERRFQIRRLFGVEYLDDKRITERRNDTHGRRA